MKNLNQERMKYIVETINFAVYFFMRLMNLPFYHICRYQSSFVIENVNVVSRDVKAIFLP